MSNMKTAVLMLMAVVASASTIQFRGTSGVNNGSVYVGPYLLTEDGVDIFGTCISPDLHVGPPYSWDAERYYISDFAGPERTKVLEAAWLTQQFGPAPSASWVTISQAIWDIFGAGYSDTATLDLVSQAEGTWGSVSPNSFYVLVPVDVVGEEPQHFIVQAAPEPGTWLLGVGLVLIGGVRRRV